MNRVWARKFVRARLAELADELAGNPDPLYSAEARALIAEQFRWAAGYLRLGAEVSDRPANLQPLTYPDGVVPVEWRGLHGTEPEPVPEPAEQPA